MKIKTNIIAIVLIILMLISCRNHKISETKHTLFTANEMNRIQEQFAVINKQLKTDSPGLSVFSLSGDNYSYVGSGLTSTYSITIEWLENICKLKDISKLNYTQLLDPSSFQLSTKNNTIHINYPDKHKRCKSNDLLKSQNLKKTSEGVITVDRTDFIKIFNANYNAISLALENIIKADNIKNLLETSRCIEGWHVQHSLGAKIYWNLVKIPDNTILTVLLPQLKLGIIQSAKKFDWDKSGLTAEEDILFNPFMAQIFEILLPKLVANPVVIKKVLSDLKTKEIIGIKRASGLDNQIKNAGNSLSLYNLPLASINYVPDNYYGRREFVLDDNTEVRIVAVGEGNSTVNSEKDLDRDHIEFFFDMNNNRKGPVDAKDFDSQYRISVFDSSIFGTYNSTKGIKFAYKLESKNVYNIEIFFPWNTLGYILPKDNARFGFDVGLSDNDESGREAKIMWHARNDSTYLNTAFLGQLKLVDFYSGKGSDSLLQSVNTNINPVIDGIEDYCWKNIATDTISHLTVGLLDNSNDIAGSFKSLWNKNGIYFFIKVTDDVIIRNSNIKSDCYDYGWIEEANSDEKNWRMRKLNSLPTGNEKINMYCDTVILLKKGTYNLFYTSDDSHSYLKWFDPEEYLPFYGIKVLKK